MGMLWETNEKKRKKKDRLKRNKAKIAKKMKKVSVEQSEDPLEVDESLNVWTAADEKDDD